MSFSLEAVTAGYAGFSLGPVSLEFPAGKMTAIIGPNGCGKSTLLRVLARQIRPQQGHVRLAGCNIDEIPARGLARQVAILPQAPVVPPGISVEQLVGYGRAPHQNLLGMQSWQDREAVAAAMARTDIACFARRMVESLSGGQRQRAFLAMTLAQQANTLLFDEPTSWLDILHQVQTLRLIRALAHEGRTCIAVLHDIAQAARYADHLVVMLNGQVVAAGAPDRILTPELLQRVYDLPVIIHRDPVTGTPLPVPLEDA